jgi:hypothetical protein
LNNNIIEGLVFKANKRHYLHIQRPIFKRKNDRWKEVRVTKNTYIHQITKSYLEEKSILYCTKNRFINLISKVGKENSTENITKQYVDDVIEDFKQFLMEDNDNKYLDFSNYYSSITRYIYCYLNEKKLIDKWISKLSD